MEFTRKNIINGAAIFAAGDTAAAIISGEFNLYRLFGIALIGGSLYAFEIPNFFNWIEKVSAKYYGWRAAALKTTLSVLFFNPLWIARHLLFIKVASLAFDQITWEILTVSWISFLVNIPVSALGNYVIQNNFSLKSRFVASAVFSGLMAIYYGLSEGWFG